MHFAVMSGSLEIAMLLDAKGADATSVNLQGVSPIMMGMNKKNFALYFKSQAKYKDVQFNF